MATTQAPAPPRRAGALVSIEGVNGVGKTYLTGPITERLAAAGRRPLVLDEYSRRLHDTGADLGRAIIRALAADGDYFLRGGHPRSETLLLLAVKIHDYEAARPALAAGQLVIEGRSLYTTAAYQAAILHPDDTAAHDEAHAIIGLATPWRPLPDLTILITDDHATARARAEQRDGRAFTPDERRLHRRAGALLDALAASGRYRIQAIDRRHCGTAELVARAAQAITLAATR